MNVDRLVEKAQLALDRGNYEEAKDCLKKAASAAPLRGDIRELLTQTLAMGPGNGEAREAEPPRPPRENRVLPRRPPEPRRPMASLGATRQRTSFFKPILIVVACVCLIGLGITGYLVARRMGIELIPSNGPSSSPTAKPSPTPGPEEARTKEILSAAEAKAQEGKYQEAVDSVKAALVSNPPGRDALAKSSLRASNSSRSAARRCIGYVPSASVVAIISLLALSRPVRYARP